MYKKHRVINDGKPLEQTVYEIYKDLPHLGYWNVVTDIQLSKKTGSSLRHQMDVSYQYYGGPTIYVECKSRESTVHLNNVADFIVKLDLLKVPYLLPFRGEIVSDTKFDKRVIEAAKNARIKLVDRDDLEKLSEQRRTGLGTAIMTYNAVRELKKQGISGMLRYLAPRFWSFEKQLSEKRYT